MDSDAANYSSTATSDNGSCTYSVSFAVDMSEASLGADDRAYVNGQFNGWCGTCNPMSHSGTGDIWEVVLPLAVGEYEYKFTGEWLGISGEYTPGGVVRLSTDR